MTGAHPLKDNKYDDSTHIDKANRCWKFRLQIPQNVSSKLQDWEKNNPFPGFRVDNIKILISLIATHQREDDNGVVSAPLVMQYLRRYVCGADRYIRLLLDEGIIQRIGGYVPGDHAYKYQFTPEYRSEHTAYMMENPQLNRRLKRILGHNGRKNSRKYPKQNALIRDMTIDPTQAEGIARMFYGGDDNTEAFNFALGSITRIINKDFYSKVDDSGYRLHTNLTNLPKILRGLVQIRGKNLSGIDIRNSQPYIANKLLSDPEGAKDYYPGALPYMMIKCLRLPEQEDVRRYELLTSQAGFYKYLETEFNKRGANYPVVSESTVSNDLKEKVFQIMFDKNHHTSRERKIFRELFPNVEKAFSVLRMNNYTDFVNSLTRMETHVILDKVLEYLNAAYPDMVATQIYDNITTTLATDDIEKAAAALTAELTDFIGIPPTLKYEYYTTQY